MTKMDAIRQFWALLDEREKKNARLTLVVIIAAALFSAATVGVIFPFLTVILQPQLIHSVGILEAAYVRFGFTSDYAFLVALGALCFAVIVVMYVMQMVKVYAISRFTQMRVHSLSHRLLTRHLGQPYEFFLHTHTSAIAKSILAETSFVVQRFMRPVADFVAAVMTVLAIVGLLLWINPAVATVALASIGGVYALIFFLTRPRLNKLGERRAHHNAMRYRVAGEALAGVKDIKILGREAAFARRFHKPSLMMSRTLTQLDLLASLPQLLIQAFILGGVVLTCLLVLDRAAFDAGSSNFGTALPLLGVFAFAGQRLMPELSRLYQAIALIQSGVAAVHELSKEAAALRHAEALPDAPPAPLGLKRELRLETVTYRYPGASTGGVSDVSLSIGKGQKIGIVGSTGAGKTTLVDIVLGLLRPQSGALVADGVPITAQTLRAWQQTIGYVPQDIFLVDASIAENIALGIPAQEIDVDRVARAARIAQLGDFVEQQLDKGYWTDIGERGLRLSGGQRQRIGIARALYHEADVLVFDEATSALDNATEREVMAAIGALSRDKTILIIAHRLSTVRICDRILVLDQGRVAAFGPWQQLLAGSSQFQALVNAGSSESRPGAGGCLV